MMRSLVADAAEVKVAVVVAVVVEAAAEVEDAIETPIKSSQVVIVQVAGGVSALHEV